MRSLPTARAALFAGITLAATLAALPAGAQWIGAAGGSGDTSPSASAPAAVTIEPMPQSGAMQPGAMQPGATQPASPGFSPGLGMGGMGGAPGAAPMGAPPQANPNMAECQSQVEKLRTTLEGSGEGLQKAVKNKRPPSELCPMFRNFASAQQNFYKFLSSNKTKCGVPDDVLKKIKTNADSVASTRNKVCEVAKAQESGMAPGGGNAGPSGPPPQGSVSAGLGLPSGLPTLGAPPGGVFDTLGGDALR
ncbi:hypothetical protein MWN33_05960 [Starkeya koreensis]|uniref:Uncharacterized protein n=1 Tax=Ancylobacter koreensis TaxID=266121 RepID=A0ABT0DJX5_9HYPH|nr:hypothetical protein [Ancylobacter koreensis]MCK0207575.1 hypothetical protein [Ancylobacter koreensis]